MTWYGNEHYSGPIWEQQKQQLQSLHDMVTNRGGRMMVVTFPFLHALDGDYEYGQIHRDIDDFWQAANVPHLDLLSLYDDYKADELVVNPYDAHPNVFAHSLAAKSIAEFIEMEMAKE